MRSGFTYKGRHSSEFGAVAKTISRPVLPEMKDYTFDTPLMDGVYDFSEANEYGRAFYNDRFFEIQLQAGADNLRSLEKKISKLAAWIKGSGELIFDDMPLVKWNARVISEMCFVPERYGKKAALTAVFRVEPFGRCIFNTIDGPALNDPAELDDNIPIDVSGAFTWSLDGGADEYKLVSGNLSVVNMGNVHIRPVIKIAGDVKNIAFSNGRKALEINTSGDGFIVDFKKNTVSDMNGKSVMTSVGGEFFELGTQTENIAVSLYIKGSAVITAEYEPVFIYDCDFDEVDWSENNAEIV